MLSKWKVVFSSNRLYLLFNISISTKDNHSFTNAMYLMLQCNNECLSSIITTTRINYSANGIEKRSE